MRHALVFSSTVACAVAMAAWTGTVHAQPNLARQQQCGAKLEKAQQLDMVSRVDTKTPGALRVVVGHIYFKVGFDAKEGLAETVSCYLVKGDPKLCAEFDLVSWDSGKLVGRFENCRLKPV